MALNNGWVVGCAVEVCGGDGVVAEGGGGQKVVFPTIGFLVNDLTVAAVNSIVTPNAKPLGTWSANVTTPLKTETTVDVNVLPLPSVSVMVLPADTALILPTVKAAVSATLVAPAATLASEVVCAKVPGECVGLAAACAGD